ncbi:Spore protein YkvP [Paenibacillus konkukensis]|uniref:Spore protein YkvP n=1 Tax=Paenibacillus konkukensis TaxID=2020716 RepID=A0ABY4RFD2_9BACL|nr:glycosyltransferase [Paenibacillus konkukensis]UQZ80978.1 Spore protein YkvP [Paenibacillus konkukensis]
MKAPLHVHFITSGVGSPYPPLESAIIHALREQVQQVTVAHPKEELPAGSGKPDLLLVFHALFMPRHRLSQLKRAAAQTAVWFTDDPYYSDWSKEIAVHFDFVFTQDRNSVQRYERLGCKRVYHLPLAADTSVFHPVKVPDSYASDLCFIGSAFWNRVRFFEQIIARLEDKKVTILGLWWDRLKAPEGSHVMLSRSHGDEGWISSEEAVRYYNGAKIVLNIHRSIDDPFNQNSSALDAHSINNRTFEIAACGAFQLLDIRKDLGEYYTPGKDIIPFASVEECVRLINLYLSKDRKRRAIAERARRRTLSEHTYGKRIEALLKAIGLAAGEGT